MAKRLLKMTISLAYFILDYVVDIVIGKRNKAKYEVILYHSVLTNERVKFARQMETLKKIAMPISVRDLDSLPPNGHYVIVTFDDAFLNIAENALGELIRHHIEAIVFVPSAYLGRMPRWTKNVSDRTDHEKVMTAAQLRSFPAERITIGSHCMTHPNLKMISEKEAKIEIVGSKNELERELNREITLLAYPYGEYDDQIMEWSRQAGYERVFTALPSGTDGFVEGRINVSPNDWGLEFRLKVLGGYRWLPFAASLKQKLLVSAIFLTTKFSRIQ